VACLPPHITVKQAQHYWQAIFKGDPDSRQMVRQSLRQMIEAWKPA
jgi:hypothetical protein